MGVTYETLKRLQLISRPGDWAISFDLADGFHAVSIAPEDRKYLTIQLQGQYYQLAVLPFGLSQSPAVFCRCMRVLTRLLRNPETPLRRDDMSPAHWLSMRDKLLQRPAVGYTGMRTLPFCDDYLALFSSREAAKEGRTIIDRVLDFLGLDRQPSKGVWEPTQTLYHLGFDI